jgi:hypothetical protein
MNLSSKEERPIDTKKTLLSIRELESKSKNYLGKYRIVKARQECEVGRKMHFKI